MCGVNSICERLLSGADIYFCTKLSANNRDEENWKEENRKESAFVGALDRKTTLLECKPRR